MKKYSNPSLDQWSELTQRPTIDQGDLTDTVSAILDNVKDNGDKALYEYAEKFDGVKLSSLTVSPEEVKQACELVDAELKNAIEIAYTNISTFHQSQIEQPKIIETQPGVKCWRKSVAIDKVGLYIPGGTAPLFSTVLMLGIPAKIAGCNEIVLCTPPNSEGQINPVILYVAHKIGIQKIFKVGGAQAIGAMCLGTESIPQVYKIFGPGNQYVTKAKELAMQYGVSIDMPAGPSEVLVIADETGNPEFIASDLLSQAEHGIDSQVILICTDDTIVDETIKQVDAQLSVLPRKAIATEAISKSACIVMEKIEDCISFSNLYAPEHLIIASDKANEMIDQITNAGSVFIGNYSCESAGDYASGTNHTLPTNGFSKQFSGVSLDSFVKKITFQELNKEGINHIGKAIEVMAEAEGLMAHKNAVTVRLNS